jgi:hypothetical protein
MKAKNNICIYHGNCSDGFTAAWAVWKRFGDSMEYHAGFYGDAPPDVRGKRVIIVDFSYSKDVLRKMVLEAESLIVIDHHKTAQEALAWMPKAVLEPPYEYINDPWSHHIGFDSSFLNMQGHPSCCAWFDMEKSGARMAWEFFHPKTRVPKLIEHVEDRDLWRFKLYGTREIQAVVFSHPYDFDVLNELATRCEHDPDEMIREGAAIERKHFKDVDELVKVSMREMKIGGNWVWCANLPYTLASDACHAMCKMPMIDPRDGHGLLNPPPFAASYWDGPKGRTFSLRSIGDTMDVSAVAKLYGGGGHKNAAGFTQPIGWEGDE